MIILLTYNICLKIFIYFYKIIYNCLYMGCCDVFCFLCGNTCHSAFSNIKESFLENVELYVKKKIPNGLKHILNQFMKFIIKIQKYF